MNEGKIIRSGNTLFLEIGQKRIRIPQQFNMPHDIDGLIVDDYQLNRNRENWIDYITIKGVKYPQRRENFDRRNHPQRDHTARNQNMNQNQHDPGRSPYNFISLNPKVIKLKGAVQDLSKFDGLSGTISINLAVEQPIFIRGGNGDFFNVNNKFLIPGSSLRGLIKNLVKIIAYGKFDQFDDNDLYRRSNLATDGNDIKNGFLKYEAGEYRIYGAKYDADSGINNEYVYEFDSANKCKFSTGKFMGSPKVWLFEKTSTTHLHIIQHDVIESYIDDISRDEKAIDIIKSLKSKKIVNGEGKNISNSTVDTPVPDALGIPIFYRLEINADGTKVVKSFGHARFHRIPCKFSIGKNINQINNEKDLDFADIIFGTLQQASKVFFNDLESDANVKQELAKPIHPKILSSPKPTTFQHYLEQPDGIKTKTKKNWDHKDAVIRGFKCYWHRQTSSSQDSSDEHSWVETGKKSKSNPDPINPISKGSTFSGSIRFENLTPEELGALLFAIQLPEGCCHKLGMGKPLGLGSVKISVEELKIIDRKKRYEILFNTDGTWNTNEANEKDKLDYYRGQFKKYILDKLPKEEKTLADGTVAPSLWDTPRLKELKTMLTFNHNMSGAKVGWLDRTRYMEIDRKQFNPDGTIKQKYRNGNRVDDTINEFKYRPVLPKPTEVVKNDMYKKK